LKSKMATFLMGQLGEATLFGPSGNVGDLHQSNVLRWTFSDAFYRCEQGNIWTPDTIFNDLQVSRDYV
jgi:hypothetical protein